MSKQLPHYDEPQYFGGNYPAMPAVEYIRLSNELNYPLICYIQSATIGTMYKYRNSFEEQLARAESQREDDQVDAAFELRR